MTTLLAIETSTDLASVALIQNHQIVFRDLPGVHTHSYGLLPAVQDLLHECGMTLRQLDAIAFGCGPGAFTGVRTACGVVQGLAYGLQIPVLPVVSLLAMAESANASNQCVDLVCCLDARMNEVYWAHYRLQDECWVEVQVPALSDFVTALRYAREKNLMVALGQGLELSDADRDMQHLSVMPHAQFTVHIGQRDFLRGLGMDAASAQPLYLRNKVAQTTAERALSREG